LRIDKYLKVSRLAKRRSEAHEALVNGRIAKDGRKYLTVRILHVPERVTPALRTIAMYEVLAERADEPADWLA
jgi:ribosomal 50S subunit-recycling heat shock protein